jgi:hypothetical protein
MKSNTTHEATCCCGQLSLTYTGEILKTSLCHCFQCQKRTGSVFGVQTRIDRDKTQFRGNSKTYERTGDEGIDPIKFHFCPDCGSTVFYEAAWLKDSVAVPIGAFADPTLPSPIMQIYGERKHHWVTLPSSTQEFFE